MPAETNSLTFCEPYMLAMAADAEGNTGCQFFVTLAEAPHLNKSKHTIIGRLLRGKETAKVIEGIEEYRLFQEEGMSFFGVKLDKKKQEQQRSQCSFEIGGCGVYQFDKRPSDRQKLS